MGKSDSLITDEGERSDVATAQRYYEKKDFSLPKNKNNDLRWQVKQLSRKAKKLPINLWRVKINK